VDRTDLDALVLGAGVSGLTTAVCLAESGLRVRVWADELPPATTSAAAGAMWGPYLVEPVDRVTAWSDRTLDTLRNLAGDPASGVRLVSGIEACRVAVDPPEWGSRLAGFGLCQPGELPNGFVAAWRYTAPVIDMPIYLGYLQQRLAAVNVTIQTRRVDAFDRAFAAAPIVVNCCGLGARHLVPDPDLTPIRGQLVVVDNPGLDEFFSEDTGMSPDLTHFYPHGDTVILGGTAEPGEWSRQPDPATAAAIIDRCADIEPRLRTARILGHRVGLRPTRPTIRLDEQPVHNGWLIHNYGHGGAGVTLSWGCAAEVAELAAAHLGDRDT